MLNAKYQLYQWMFDEKQCKINNNNSSWQVMYKLIWFHKVDPDVNCQKYLHLVSSITEFFKINCDRIRSWKMKDEEGKSGDENHSKISILMTLVDDFIITQTYTTCNLDIANLVELPILIYHKKCCVYFSLFCILN